MKKLLAAACALFLFACGNPSEPTSDTLPSVNSTTQRSSFTDAESAKSRLLQLHTDLENMAFDNSTEQENIVAINTELHTTWEEIAKQNLWKDATIRLNDSENPMSIYLLSDDEKLAIITWNSQLGGTMLDIEGIAIFETPEGVKTKTLFANEKGGSDFINDSGMSYQELYTLTNSKGVATYYAYGMSSMSSMMPVYVLTAFQVSNDLVQNVPVVKGENNAFFMSYDLINTPDIEINGFVFSADKKKITVPQSNSDAMPTGKNADYIFNGDEYEKK
jgi:hypothetical protein